VRRLLLGCGVLSSVLYVLVVSLPYEGYSPVSQNVSELLAVGAPTRPLMVVVLVGAYNLLVLALAAGVWVSPGRKRTLRVTAVMLALFAILGAIGGGIFNMDMRGAESTPRGALHPAMTAVMSIPIVLSLIFGAFLHGRRFGLLSLATIVAAAGGGVLTAQDVPLLEANLPTPWMGLKERINIYPYMLWVAALALSLWPGRGAGPAGGETMASTPATRLAPKEAPLLPPVTTAPPAPPAPPLVAFIRRHAVLTYCAIAFAISWGGLLLLYGPGGLTSSAWRSDPRATFIGVALLAGPSVAGILLTGVTSGRAGYRELLARLVRWRVGVGWYAVALLTAPLLAAATNFALSFFSPVFLPAVATADDKGSLVLSGITLGLMIGFFEELGWTGFAIPRLRLRYGVLSTGLIVGVVWGAWHFLPNLESGSFAAALPLSLLLARIFAWLPAFRLLMVWVYEQTGSLLVAILMHASLVAGSSVVFAPPAVTAERDFLTGIVGWAAVLWAVVAVVAVARGLRMRRAHAAGSE
jgi:membrane protease YdiL (CAAX protease family)